MDFYTSIHPWYDQIFPFSPVQRDFVLSFGANPEYSVADIGCGTGSLIVQLAKVFRNTAGLDPDNAMLETARRKAGAESAGTWLISGGMLDLNSKFNPHTVDRLICFGNTLPHLTDAAEAGEFARQASVVIKPGGLLMLQIINYDRILDGKLPGLPTIENESIRFERIYEYPGDPSHILFISRLTAKATGEVVENRVPLLAMRPAMLRQILENAGYRELEEFGSFKKDSFKADSQAYIVKARL